jgi:hypothetical protein
MDTIMESLSTKSQRIICWYTKSQNPNFSLPFTLFWQHYFHHQASNQQGAYTGSFSFQALAKLAGTKVTYSDIIPFPFLQL